MVSWDGEKPSKPEQAGTPKVHKKKTFFEPQLRPREAKKAKYATFQTEFPKIRLTPILMVKKNSDF